MVLEKITSRWTRTVNGSTEALTIQLVLPFSSTARSYLELDSLLRVSPPGITTQEFNRIVKLV